MKHPTLYRKRLIPEQCIHLKDDIILYQDQDIIVTSWKTLRPKKDLDHGTSCYFLEKGYKISKFYDKKGSLIYWYCDIIDYQFDEEANILTTVDLLADVIIYPDGQIHVVDLDELAQAFESGKLSAALMSQSLYRLNSLLTILYNNQFHTLQAVINQVESATES